MVHQTPPAGKNCKAPQIMFSKKGFRNPGTLSLSRQNPALLLFLHRRADAQTQGVELNEAGRIGLIITAGFVEADDF